MSEPVPEEEQGGDPPCWAVQFADEDSGQEGDGGSRQVPQKGPESPAPDR